MALLSDQEILPDATSDRRVNVLERANETAARQMGLQPQRLYIKGPNPDIDTALAAMKRDAAEALVVLEGPVTIAHRKRIAELAIAERLPTLFAGGRTVSDAGGLIAYGTSLLDTLPRMPTYVDRTSLRRIGELRRIGLRRIGLRRRPCSRGNRFCANCSPSRGAPGPAVRAAVLKTITTRSNSA